MEITWYGHSCFKLAERGLATVITDPYDSKLVGYSPLKLKADIVTVSHDTPGHNFVSAVKGDAHIIDGPGEFEIGSVFVTGIQTNGHVKKSDAEMRNTLYLFDFNGINVLHLGDLNRIPSQAEVEDFGPINVALIPVGGGGALNANKAVEIISLLEPNIVIPMHYATPATGDTAQKLDPLSKFLKEMGLTNPETLPSLKIANLAALPEETKVVVLDYAKN
ncbi:MAG: MBL fold metallo-hydrolase [Anaerolineaceae bacterium]|jgi:L-ascorbate metabolism protein UlaG (beta-lactamase superfamily)|nr:MBL fold metallo-hydrolase [Anaerolineaceae bacterium]